MKRLAVITLTTLCACGTVDDVNSLPASPCPKNTRLHKLCTPEWVGLIALECVDENNVHTGPELQYVQRTDGYFALTAIRCWRNNQHCSSLASANETATCVDDCIEHAYALAANSGIETSCKK